MGWLGTAWDYTLGDKGSGIGGDLGFKAPNAKPLQQEKDAYKGISDTAGSTLGQDYTAPQATAPMWQKADVDTSTVAQQADTSLAGSAQMAAARANQVFLNQYQANQSRAGQNQLITGLQRTAQGYGPSVAQEQLRQATTSNINQQMAAARSAHGASRMAALRNSMWNGAATQQTANSQASALRAQEIAGAQNMLGSALSMQRQQDVSTAAQQAALAQQTEIANSGYQQGANLANAQLEQGSNQFNAGALNAGSQFNAGQRNAMASFNAGQGNAAAAAYAQQANAGNSLYGINNLSSQLQTNSLNTQRQNAYINSLLNSQQGQVGIDSLLYSGDADWLQTKRGITGSLVNKAGEAMGVPGFQGGGGLNLTGSGGNYGSGGGGGMSPGSSSYVPEMW